MPDKSKTKRKRKSNPVHEETYRRRRVIAKKKR